MDDITSPLRRQLIATALLGSLPLARAEAQAQSNAYPAKPVRLVVGFAPGGGSDFIARLVSQKLTEKFGQTFLVENKPGAGGNIAADTVVRAPADGYTLCLAAPSYTVNPALYKLNFDTVKDVTPIAQLARGPFVIAVNPQVPAHTLKELVALAKKQPGQLTYASAGNGSVTHMVTEYFLDVAGIDVLHVPYKGTSPALTDTIAGQTQVIFGTIASTLPFVKSGKLRALAVTTPARLNALQSTPTVVESGWADFQVTNWHGIFGPKGMSADTVTRLNKAIIEALNAPGMDAHLASDGLTATSSTPADFGKLLASEVERWGALARKRNIKL